MSSPAGRAFDALQAQYRRHLLLALLEENPQSDEERDPLRLLIKSGRVDDVDTGRVARYHIHLPKLQDLDYIRRNPDTAQISKGPRWDEVSPLLELIRNHRDELPDDWL